MLYRVPFLKETATPLMWTGVGPKLLCARAETGKRFVSEISVWGEQ